MKKVLKAAVEGATIHIVFASTEYLIRGIRLVESVTDVVEARRR